jgi:uncharacterized protein (TIGR04255 family)
MPSEKLSNPPLVEAILEIRWRLTEPAPGVAIDPGYKLLVGRLHERVSAEYPFHEPLPTASMPDEMLGYVVQHRFRKAQDEWPLVQVGPGVVTLNETASYLWDDFQARGLQLQKSLFDAYPGAQEAPTVVNLQLRYIDSVTFDFENEDVLAFVARNLQVELGLASGLFDDLPVVSPPHALNAFLAFRTMEPKGSLSLRFARGLRNDAPALVWETVVQSEGQDLPEMPLGFASWLGAAHEVTHRLFLKMIRGPLEEQFR